MNKYSDDKSYSESDNDEELEETRTQGGHDEGPIVNHQNAIVTEQKSEIRKVVVGFLVHLASVFFAFILNFISRIFSLDRSIAEKSSSQPRLRLTNCLKQRMKNCKHPAHKNLEKTALIREIPTGHFELMVQDNIRDKKLVKNETSEAINSLNTNLINRLLEIDARAPDNIKLKLLSYQEWVDALMKVIYVLQMHNSEQEAENLRFVREFSIKNAENLKLIKSYKGDIVRLIDYVKQAKNEGNWDLGNFIFENFDVSRIF